MVPVQSGNTVDAADKFDVRGVALDELNQVNRGRFMIPTNGSDLSLKYIGERERGGSQHPPGSGLSRSHGSGSEQPHVSHNRCHTCSNGNPSSRFKTLHLFVSGFSVPR